MLRANYTEQDRQTFEHLRYHYPDVRIMKRFEILWLHSHDKHVPEIAELVHQDRRTVRSVIKKFQEGGIELVSKIEYHQPTSELAKHQTSIIEEFTLRPPSSAKETSNLSIAHFFYFFFVYAMQMSEFMQNGNANLSTQIASTHSSPFISGGGNDAPTKNCYTVRQMNRRT